MGIFILCRMPALGSLTILCARSPLQTSAVLVKMFPELNGIGGAWLYTTLHKPRWDLVIEEVRLMKRGFEVWLLSGRNTYLDSGCSRYQLQGSRLPV